MSMTIDKKCCVPTCGKSRVGGTILHNFPNYEKEPERFRTWLYAIGGDLLLLDNTAIFKYRRVCHNHFQPRFYTSSKRLCANAVPTLNLPGFHIKKRPVQEVIESKESTRQFSSGGEAVVKCALNETPMSRADHKRVRLDPAKSINTKTYAQADSTSLRVAVTCGHTGYISKDISKKVLTEIQAKVVHEGRIAKEGDVGPVFYGKPMYAEGVLKLWCGNEDTKKWLQDTVSHLPLNFSFPLVVQSQSEILRRIKCGILIPNEQGVLDDPRDVGSTLAYQNRWANISRWLLLNIIKQTTGWFVVVGVPEDQVPALMKAERRLSMGLGAVYLKFQGPHGKFQDFPQGWDPATATILEQQPKVGTDSPNNAPIAGEDATMKNKCTHGATSKDSDPSLTGDPDDFLLSSSSLGMDEVDTCGLLPELYEDGVPFVNLSPS